MQRITENLLAKIGVDTAENENLKITDSAAGENKELLGSSRLLKTYIVHAPPRGAEAAPRTLLSSRADGLRSIVSPPSPDETT